MQFTSVAVGRELETRDLRIDYVNNSEEWTKTQTVCGMFEGVGLWNWVERGGGAQMLSKCKRCKNKCREMSSRLVYGASYYDTDYRC